VQRRRRAARTDLQNAGLSRNIAGIYGFEDANDMHAIIMELVEGSTLADRIAKGRFG
jgi:hypothetical protein